jgi:hypothetical protein
MKVQNIQRKLHQFECVKGCGAFRREVQMRGLGLQRNKRGEINEEATSSRGCHGFSVSTGVEQFLQKWECVLCTV